MPVKPSATGVTENEIYTPEPPQVSEPKIEYVAASQINVPYDRAWLETEADVERYLQVMSQTLLNEIRKGKRIHV